MRQRELQHLLSRAAFGMSSKHFNRYRDMSRSEVVDDLFKQSETTTPLDVDLSGFLNEAGQLSMRNKKDLAIGGVHTNIL